MDHDATADDNSAVNDAEPDLPLPVQPGGGRPPPVHLGHPAALPAGGQAALCTARGEVMYILFQIGSFFFFFS